MSNLTVISPEINLAIETMVNQTIAKVVNGEIDRKVKERVSEISSNELQSLKQVVGGESKAFVASVVKEQFTAEVEEAVLSAMKTIKKKVDDDLEEFKVKVHNFGLSVNDLRINSTHQKQLVEFAELKREFISYKEAFVRVMTEWGLFKENMGQSVANKPIRDLWAESGATLPEIAKATHITESYASKIVNGNRDNEENVSRVKSYLISRINTKK